MEYIFFKFEWKLASMIGQETVFFSLQLSNLAFNVHFDQ